MNVDEARLFARFRAADLIEPLRRAFAEEITVPERAHLDLDDGGTLLLMPAWRSGGAIGVKVATVHPGNANMDLPTVNATYLLLSADTGERLAVIDGRALTLLRTAAVSALAADLLAPAEPATLLAVGTGALIPHLVAAHMAVRDYARVFVWGRDAAKAARVAAGLAQADVPAFPVAALGPAVRKAGVITCATLSEAPLVTGAMLRPGQHLDLVGGFRPSMRECDDAAVARARVVVDAMDAVRNAGDLVHPVARGVLNPARIATLAQLVRSEAAHPRSSEAVTLFKSVGTARADLAAAEHIVSALQAATDPGSSGSD